MTNDYELVATGEQGVIDELVRADAAREPWREVQPRYSRNIAEI